MVLTAVRSNQLCTKTTAKLLLIMKLTAILLLSACLAASATGHGQKISLTVKDASLEEVFAYIKAQTNYSFLYKDEVLKKAARINVDVKDATLENVLDLCFKNQPLTYKIFERTIVVKEKEPFIASDDVVASEAKQTPPIDIRGRIVNEAGEPLEGVTVKIKGTDIGTSTNANGGNGNFL